MMLISHATCLSVCLVLNAHALSLVFAAVCLCVSVVSRGDVVAKPWEPYLSTPTVHALGAGLGWLSATTALGMGLPTALIGTLEWMVASCFVGAAVGVQTDALQMAAPHLIKLLDWELDSLACWNDICEAHTANTTNAAAAAAAAAASAATAAASGAADTKAGGGAAAGQRAAAAAAAAATEGGDASSIATAVEKGLSTENFDLSENLRRGDERQVDPALFVIEEIMAVEGCDFDSARLLYNKRKMVEAGVDPETGLPLPETLSRPGDHFGDRATDLGAAGGSVPAVAVLYHQSDGMIPYRFASLAAAMEQQGAFAPGGTHYEEPNGMAPMRAREIFEMSLRGQDVNSHMYPLSTHPHEWNELVGVCRRLLGEAAA